MAILTDIIQLEGFSMSMSGVKKSKAKKMQATASKATTCTVKGRNKVPKLGRSDPKKRPASKAPVGRGFRNPAGRPSQHST